MSVRARLAVASGGIFGTLFLGFVAMFVFVYRTPFWIAVLYVLGIYAVAAILIAVIFAAMDWAMKGGRDG